MGNERKLTVILAGDHKGLDNALGAAGRSADGFGSKLATFGKVAAIGLGAAAVGAVKLGSDFVKAAIESEKVGKQTEAVFKSMGATAGGTSAAGVAKLAETLSMKTGVDDEVIQSAENVLLTFGKVRNEVGKGNDVFDRGTKAALDMSVALGTDMQGATIQIGKALNDPIKGITALGRAGVSFSEDQKKAIRTMVETGDTLGAQKMILGELEKQFGGSAEAQATAGEKLKVIWGNLQEKLGAQLLPVVEKVGSFLANKLPGAFEAVGKAAGPIFEAIRQGVTAFANAWRYFDGEVTSSGVNGKLEELGFTARTVFEAYKNYVGALVAFVRENWPKIQEVIGQVMSTVSSIISGAVAVITTLWNNFGDNILELILRIWPRVQQVIEGALTVVRGIVQTITALIHGDWSAVWDGIKVTVTGAWELIQGIVGGALEGLRSAIGVVLEVIGSMFKGAFEAIGAQLTGAWEAIKGVFSAAFTFLTTALSAWWEATTATWAAGWAAVTAAIGVAWEAIKGAFVAAWEFITGVFTAAWDAIKAGFELWFDAVKTVITTYIDVYKTIFTTAWEAIKAVISAAWEGIKTVVTAALDFVKEMIDRQVRGWQNIISTAWGLIKGIFDTALNGIKVVVQGAWSAITSVVQGAANTLRNVASSLWNPLRDATSSARDFLRGAVETIVGFFTGLPGRIRSAFAGLSNAITSPFTAAFQAIRNFWNNTVGGKTLFKVPDIPGLPFRGQKFTIPRLHTGGIVPGGKTNEPLYQLQGGEGVFTRDQMKALGMRMAGNVKARATEPTPVHLHLEGGTYLGTNQEQLGRELVALVNLMLGKGMRLEVR